MGYEIVNPYDNMANLSGDFNCGPGSATGPRKERFLSGEIIEDVENALWRRAYVTA